MVWVRRKKRTTVKRKPRVKRAPRKRNSTKKIVKKFAHVDTKAKVIRARDVEFGTRSLYPQTRMITFDYYDHMYLYFATSERHLQIYRSNSLYDFDLSNNGTDHQPYGFDQMMGGGAGQYIDYKVYSVDFEFKFWNNAAIPTIVLFQTDTNNNADTYPTTPAEVFAAIEAGGDYILLDPSIAAYRSVGVRKLVHIDNAKVSMDKDYKSLYEDGTLSEWSGQYNANPSKLTYMGFTVMSFDGATDPAVYVQVHAKISAIVYNPAVIGQS